MSTSHGYSDRISHALAFAAKHLPSRPRRGSGALHLTQPANVAVILARYGCDEITIISGILSHLVNEASYGSRTQLSNKIAEKFGTMVFVQSSRRQDTATCENSTLLPPIVITTASTPRVCWRCSS